MPRRMEPLIQPCDLDLMHYMLNGNIPFGLRCPISCLPPCMLALRKIVLVMVCF